jgi:hypothetical protein
MELCLIQKLVGGMPISTTTLSIMAKLRQLILTSTHFKQINIFMSYPAHSIVILDMQDPD